MTAPLPRDESARFAARAALGDADAFEALVTPHLPRAMQLASRIMRHPQDAEDLVQDAVLRAIERIDQYDRSRAFGPWFLRLLWNHGLTRREARAVRETELLDPDLHEAPTPAYDAASDAEVRDAFATAVDLLPPRQRTILFAFDVDGLSGAEIAEQLGISAETVRWHLHAARKTLRTQLQQFRPDPTFPE